MKKQIQKGFLKGIAIGAYASFVIFVYMSVYCIFIGIEEDRPFLSIVIAVVVFVTFAYAFYQFAYYLKEQYNK